MAELNVGPTVCIASTSGGCSGAAIGRLIIDAGVTVSLTSPAGPFQVNMCVYSTLENHGVVEGGSVCDYGTILNYGTIDIPVGAYFDTLPYNGFGVLDNRQGGLIVNNYDFIDAGSVINSGTIHNKGQFGNDNQYNGTFINNGTFVGSAPCFSFDGCVTWFGLYNITSGTTVDQSLGTGVSLTIRGGSGTNVAVFSQNQTTAAPLGLGAINVSSAIFFDVMINGMTTGTARVCITNARVTVNMSGGMQYWDGSGWVAAGNQNVSGATLVRPPGPNQTTTITWSYNRLCGDIPVSALNGTPLGLGHASIGFKQTSSTMKSSTRSASSESSSSVSSASASTTTSGTSRSTGTGGSPTEGVWSTLVSNQLYVGVIVVLAVLVVVMSVYFRRKTG